MIIVNPQRKEEDFELSGIEPGSIFEIKKEDSQIDEDAENEESI